MKLKILSVMVIGLFLGSSLLPNISSLSINEIESNKSTNSYKWVQVNVDGFGNRYNNYFRGMEIFNGTLVVGTANLNFETSGLGFIGSEGKPIKQVIADLFRQYFQIKDLLSSKHFFNSSGCEIWGYNGTSWYPIIAEGGFMDPGFGDKHNSQTGFMIKFKDYLYIGTYNDFEGCNIWRSADLKSWEKVVSDGFGNKNNVWAMTSLIFNDELYVSTCNWETNAAELYRSKDGINWTAVVGGNSNTPAGFGTSGNFYIWSMCEYSSYLYAGTAGAGCEIWRSSDGLNWDPVIASKNNSRFIKLKDADYPRGFGIYMILGIRNMVVFNDELYVFSAARNGYRFVLEAFGKNLVNFTFRRLYLRYPLLNIIPDGGKIWKYNSTTDSWKRVIGGRGTDNKSAGFGDWLNQYFWSVETTNDTIFCGTAHPGPWAFKIIRDGLFSWRIAADPIGAGEIWKTNDGDNWEQINLDGFGDEHNLGIRGMIIYHGELYAGTVNLDAGCEIWKYSLSGE